MTESLDRARSICEQIEVNAPGYMGAPACAEAWATAKLIAELEGRVEALEAAAKPAEANYPELPNSSLVDIVTLQIDNGTACDRESARIARYAILEVAAWVDHLGYHSCAAELRKEIPQSC
jgi:hypothetical protein